VISDKQRRRKGNKSTAQSFCDTLPRMAPLPITRLTQLLATETPNRAAPSFILRMVNRQRPA
jgi:hypothetical protein